MLKLLWIVAGLLLLLLLGACVMQRKLVYFPDRTVPSPEQTGQTGVEQVRFLTDDGVHLSGWFAPAAGSDRHLALLHCHGNGGNVAGRAHLLRDLPPLGVSVLIFDWRGYGTSDDEPPTEDGLYRDGRAALAWLEARTALPADRIVLYGESLGTGVAVQLAAELADAGASAPHALILQSPFTSLPDVAAWHYPWLPVRLILSDRYDSLSKIGRVHAPLLVMHGVNDSVVPFDEGRTLEAAAGGPHQFIALPGTNHNDVWFRRADRVADIRAFLDGLP
jgi:uncharacterized protein